MNKQAPGQEARSLLASFRPAVERRHHLQNFGQRDSIFACVEVMGDTHASIYARIHKLSTAGTCFHLRRE